jgi:iron complex outermembrane receptor protein
MERAECNYGADVDFEKFEGNQSVYDIAKTMSSGD